MSGGCCSTRGRQTTRCHLLSPALLLRLGWEGNAAKVQQVKLGKGAVGGRTQEDVHSRHRRGSSWLWRRGHSWHCGSVAQRPRTLFWKLSEGSERVSV